MTIDLNNIGFAYPEAPDTPILTIPRWQVSAGEQVFVHGPSGGGKSTLLNLLSGILAPTTGELLVLDQALNKMSQRKRDAFRANHIGYIFQQFNLISYLSPLENIELATYFSKHNRKNAIQDDVASLLEKLNIPVGDWNKQTAKLSIGQQQRIAIARALVNKPKLLIADEPTSSLDHDNRDNFMSVLMSLAEENGITLVFVSHDMSLSDYFKRVDAMSEINTLHREH